MLEPNWFLQKVARNRVGKIEYAKCWFWRFYYWLCPVSSQKRQNSAKSYRIFSGKWRVDKALILIYLNSVMTKVFFDYRAFFSILVIFWRKQRVKVGPKVQISVRLFSIKTRIFKSFSNNDFGFGENFGTFRPYLGE